jgi:transcriptional regulator GlxA family with amidase domain
MKPTPTPFAFSGALPDDCPGAPPAVKGALAYIHGHLDEPMPLQQLASQAGLSLWRFATVFRRHTGVPPHRYICEQRVRRAQALLADGASVATAASAAGFYDQSHLARHFKYHCGMTPRQYLQRSRRLPLPAIANATDRSPTP